MKPCCRNLLECCNTLKTDINEMGTAEEQFTNQPKDLEKAEAPQTRDLWRLFSTLLPSGLFYLFPSNS